VGAGLADCRQLKPAVRPGGILMEGRSLEDLMLNVRSYVAPLTEPYN
jgi:hypothetical protein